MRLMLAVVVCLLSNVVGAQDVVLSTFSSNFRERGEGARASNVKLTATKINGTVLEPGETFSYNKTVGERTQDNGFRKAHVIVQKRLVDGWGGGACQAASTLHAAALYAGLDIVETHPHSLLSAYMPPTMDSTVAWPNVDLKFRNNTQRPIRIQAIVEPGPKGLVLRMTLLSDRPSGRNVEVSFKEISRKRRGTWKVRSAKVKRGVQVAQAGSDGLVVDRHVIVTDVTTGEIYLNQVRRFKYSPLVRILRVPQ